MAWDKTKPAANTPLVSSEVRDNFAYLDTFLGIGTDTLVVKGASKRLLIGTPTDDGVNTLQVAGNIKSTGKIGVGSNFTTPTAPIAVQNGAAAIADAVDSSLFIVNDATTGAKGLTINSFKPAITLIDRSVGQANFRIAADGSALRFEASPNGDYTFTEVPYLFGRQNMMSIGGSLSSNVQLYLRGELTGGTATTQYGVSAQTVCNALATSFIRYQAAGTVKANTALTGVHGLYVSQPTLESGVSITSQYGVYVHSGLTGATNNYGIHSNLAAAAGRWNFYGAGSADNYLAGNLGIGSSTLNTGLESGVLLQVRASSSGRAWTANGNLGILTESSGIAGVHIISGNASDGRLWFSDTDGELRGAITYIHSNDSMRFDVAGGEAMRLTSTKRLLIGTTTDDGLNLLQVNGATKVTGNFEAAGVVTVPDASFGESKLVISDVTTGNVSTSMHGFCPKAPNDPAKFLRGDASWATVPSGASAWVNFSGSSSTGTYSQSGTALTVTQTGHGLSVGMVVTLDFTSGTAVDGAYTVATVPDANTYTAVASTSITTSGNVTRQAYIRASYNVSSITDLGTGAYRINFATPMAHDKYSVVCGRDIITGTTFTIGRHVTYPQTVNDVTVLAMAGTSAGDSGVVNVVVFI